MKKIVFWLIMMLIFASLVSATEPPPSIPYKIVGMVVIDNVAIEPSSNSYKIIVTDVDGNTVGFDDDDDGLDENGLYHLTVSNPITNTLVIIHVYDKDNKELNVSTPAFGFYIMDKLSNFDEINLVVNTNEWNKRPVNNICEYNTDLESVIKILNKLCE